MSYQLWCHKASLLSIMMGLRVSLRVHPTCISNYSGPLMRNEEGRKKHKVQSMLQIAGCLCLFLILDSIALFHFTRFTCASNA